MKHLIFLIFIIIMCLNIYAQNNPSSDYLPMKVGNVFVYQWQQWMISGKYRITITKDTLINGIKYFKNEGRNNSSFTVPYPYSSQFMRVDSLTGNIYGIVNNSVCMIDSLASKLNDSSNTCYGRMPCRYQQSYDFWCIN